MRTIQTSVAGGWHRGKTGTEGPLLIHQKSGSSGRESHSSQAAHGDHRLDNYIFISPLMCTFTLIRPDMCEASISLQTPICDLLTKNTWLDAGYPASARVHPSYRLVPFIVTP